MAKKIIFFASFLLSTILIIVLLVLKLNEKKILIENEIEKQKEVSRQYETIAPAEEKPLNDGPIKLNSDEVFISSVSADLNEDGFQDEIIAIKKSLNPSVYLILAIQGPQKDTYKKVAEIKSSVTLASSLSLDVIQLQKSLPIIVCSGLGLNKEQTLSIYLIREDASKNIGFENIASVASDIQVQLKDARTTTVGSLEDYFIETYNFASNEAKTLSQRKTEYRWSARVGKFIKTSEEIIEEKDITGDMLRTLKMGDLKSYKQYLSGLWYMPKTRGENVRYVYYDKEANSFIFHTGEIEEIYIVQNMFMRRYGFSIIALNSSISTIKRHIEIDIKNIEELQLRVSEDVATLKINTASAWSGLYRKKQNSSTHAPEEEPASFAELKTLLSKSQITWTSENAIFRTTGSTYSFVYKEKEEHGSFNFMIIDGYNLLQTKSSNNERSFYIVELENNKKGEDASDSSSLGAELILKLTPCTLTFSKIEVKDEKPQIFKEFRE